MIEPGAEFFPLARGRGDRPRGGTATRRAPCSALFGRKLKAMGFEELAPEEIVREGTKAEEITKLIEED